MIVVVIVMFITLDHVQMVYSLVCTIVKLFSPAGLTLVYPQNLSIKQYFMALTLVRL